MTWALLQKDACTVNHPSAEAGCVSGVALIRFG